MTVSPSIYKAVFRVSEEGAGSFTGTFGDAVNDGKRVFGIDPSQRVPSVTEITSARDLQSYRSLGDGRRVMALSEQQLKM